jgi:hypothetical protein
MSREDAEQMASEQKTECYTEPEIPLAKCPRRDAHEANRVAPVVGQESSSYPGDTASPAKATIADALRAVTKAQDIALSAAQAFAEVAEAIQRLHDNME